MRIAGGGEGVEAQGPRAEDAQAVKDELNRPKGGGEGKGESERREAVGARAAGWRRRTLGFDAGGALGAGWRVTALAWGFAGGIAVGWEIGPGWEWWMVCGAWLSAVMGLICGWMGRGRAVMWWLIAASVLTGAGWINVHYHWVGEGELMGMVGEEGTLVRVRGVVMERPEVRAQVAGAMGRFDYRRPATYFRMSVRTAVDEHGREVEARGRVMVRVDETVEPMEAGDEVEVSGFLRGAGRPMNPGEFDYSRISRSEGEAGMLSVEDRGQVRVMRSGPSDLSGWWWRMRAQMQARACGWLLEDLPATRDTNRDALLAALLLGARTGELDGLDRAFTRVGLAHILAISGMNLALLAGFVLWVARLGGQRRAWHGWLMVGVVAAYLMMIDVRAPVLRAAVMVMAGSVGLTAGRRVNVTGLLSLSLIVLLAWRPEQVFEAGFQLSFCVVYGLVVAGQRVRERWFGEADPNAADGKGMMMEWVKTGVAVNVTAWMCAWPITVCQFGVVNPMGAAASLVGAPVAAVVMVLGYVRMLLGLALPSAAVAAGWVLVGAERVLIELVRWLDAVPGMQVHVPKGPAAWGLCALAWCGWWGLRRRGEGDVKLMWGACAGLVVWLMWPAWVQPWYREEPALRVDMLSVGDGSCYVIRSEGRVMLYDAGSGTSLNSAKRVVIPAMRWMGVRSVEGMVVSHANLDHYSDVIDLVEEFKVSEVLVNEEFVKRAEAQPWGSARYMMEEVQKRGTKVRVVNAGEELEIGRARWRWVHPTEGAEFERENDESAVVRIEAAGRVVMMYGDVGPDGIWRMMDEGLAVKADVMELPHHGSFNERAVEFLRAVKPAVVMQSTGRARWERDRWAGYLAEGTKRLVTARDGASWVEVWGNGGVRWGIHVESSAR